MRIDCKDLDCPEPVLRVKKKLEEMGDDAVLEVELNTVSSIENCRRFGENQGFEVRSKKEGDITLMTIIKGYPCDIVPEEEAPKGKLAKTFFVKSAGIGQGELGKKLMGGFLKSALELPTLPKHIIFVNEGVLLTTQEENRKIIETLQLLEKKGVEIYSCGLCLAHYGIEVEELAVGMVGNAYDTMRMMMETDVVSL